MQTPQCKHEENTIIPVNSAKMTIPRPGQACDSEAPSYWFIYCRKKLALYATPTSLTIPTLEKLPFSDNELLYSRSIGIYGKKQCIVAAVHDSISFPEEFTLTPLRKAYQFISLDLWTIAGRAMQVLHWHNEHRFCGKCGKEMVEIEHETVKSCPSCGFLSYPRLAPAVIMSVIWDNKILMGRAASFPKGMYSPLSGFVEPGETLEEAVRREVMEEAEIDVTTIQYVASQPWPFPQSLMIGFTTKYQGGTIRVDKTELEDARWFTADSMPEVLPSQMSISRTLVDKFLCETS